MKAIVSIGYTHYICDETAIPQVAAFFSAATEAEHDYTTGTYKPKDKPTVSIQFIDDSELTEKPEPLKKLQEEREMADSRWMEEWRKRDAAEERIKELEAKLEAITTAAGGATEAA